jgi:hypothetical protein
LQIRKYRGLPIDITINKLSRQARRFLAEHVKLQRNGLLLAQGHNGRPKYVRDVASSRSHVALDAPHARVVEVVLVAQRDVGSRRSCPLLTSRQVGIGDRSAQRHASSGE